MQVKTILVSFDFSEYADRALSWAVGLAKDGDAKILLLHVTPPIPAVATANALSFGALAQVDIPIVNKIRGTLNICAVKAPGFGDRRKAMLEDLAILTGGKTVAEELGIKLENMTLADLGQCKRVVVDKDNTTIIDGAGKKADVVRLVVPVERQSHLIRVALYPRQERTTVFLRSDQ